MAIYSPGYLILGTVATYLVFLGFWVHIKTGFAVIVTHYVMLSSLFNPHGYMLIIGLPGGDVAGYEMS